MENYKTIYYQFIKIISKMVFTIRFKKNGAMKKNIFFFFNLLLTLSALGGLLLNLSSCNTTEPPIIPPPPDLRKITLTFEDASCTEVWLKIKADSLTLPAEIKLLSNAVIPNIMLTTKDTVLYIDSLLPNQTYNYQALLSTDTTIKSEKVTAQTLEPTSHNFTWQSWEFGQHSSSILYDVAIIDENNIWAVGEIYMNDSLGNPDLKRFNAVVWDGNQWNVKRIPYQYQGNDFYNPIQSVFAFGPNDILFCGNGLIHWDGINFVPISIPTSVWGPYQMNKIWGRDKNEFYIVGNAGNIAHATATQFGYNFTKLESGTTLNLTGIYKSPNSDVIWISGRSGTYSHSVLLRCKNNVCEKVYEGLSTDFYNGNEIGFFPNVWSDNKYRTYLNNGFGLYVQDNDKEFSFERITPIFSDVAFGMSGDKSNNIFVAGQKGLVGHYNGYSYKEFPEIKSNSVYFNSVSVKGNIACIVGDKSGSFSSKAIIYLFNK